MAYSEQNSGCCGVEDIHELNQTTPKQSLLSICKNMWPYDPYYGQREITEKEIPAHYIFTAVVDIDNDWYQEHNKDEYYDEPEDDPELEYGFTYGDDFAEYLRKNKLGDVIETKKAMPNRVNHPNHDIKVWVWTPDPKALVAWYKRNKDK